MTDSPASLDARREAAARICRRLASAGHQAFLAGGCVRDLLLGVAPKDYDVATSATPDDVALLFARTAGVGRAFGVMLVVEPEGVFEVATFRRDGPYLDGRHPAHVTFTSAEEDARRRDFTINALFLDPARDEVLDYVGGRDDLAAGIVRTVGDPAQRFAEDYLRLLRAVRFAARLGYRIEEGTWKAVCSLAPSILHTSAERIRDELLKILTEGHAGHGFRLLDAAGLLEHVLPEVSAMKGVEQPPAFHPEGDVFTHTMLMLDHLGPCSATLALGALLHDVGKPVTQTFEDRIRFSNHDRIGAEMAQAICRRLRLSARDTQRVAWLVGSHMRLAVARDMRESKRKRFVREDGFDELLALGRLDALASHGRLETIGWLEAYREALEPESVRPEPLLTGRDLIAMGYEPGPAFSEMLGAVEDAQLEGDLTTGEEARRFVRERWPAGGPPQ